MAEPLPLDDDLHRRPRLAHEEDADTDDTTAALEDDVIDRRLGLDRRRDGAGDDTGLERRRGPGRRRTDFTRAAEEGEMTPEQFLFLKAIEAFKKANDKTFPSWTDVLEVIRLLGYRKVLPSQLNLSSVEDWTEKPDAPSGVRAKPGRCE